MLEMIVLDCCSDKLEFEEDAVERFEFLKCLKAGVSASLKTIDEASSINFKFTDISLDTADLLFKILFKRSIIFIVILGTIGVNWFRRTFEVSMPGMPQFSSIFTKPDISKSFSISF